MCNGSGMTARDAAISLSKLIERELDSKIDHVPLRLFLQNYWDRVAVYAHIIHSEAEPKKTWAECPAQQ